MADLKVAKNVPIHGCGMQAHFNAAGVGKSRCPTPRMVKQQIQRIGQLGLTVNISEMDVWVSQLSADLRQVAQKQIYHDICAAALSEAAFDGIWLWGFTDRHTDRGAPFCRTRISLSFSQLLRQQTTTTSMFLLISFDPSNLFVPVRTCWPCVLGPAARPAHDENCYMYF